MAEHVTSPNLERLIETHARLARAAEAEGGPGYGDHPAFARRFGELKWLNARANSFNAAWGGLLVPAMPELIQFNNVGMCNLRCPQCPTHSTDELHATYQTPSLTMTGEQIRRIASEAMPYATQVSTSGLGEALLHPNVETIAELVGKYGPKMYVNTNGTVGSVRRLKGLFGIAELAFSLDGAFPETFEAIRKGANYQRVMRNVRVITRASELLPAALRLDTSIQFTTCFSNLFEMPMMVDLARLLGIKKVGVTKMGFPHLPQLSIEDLNNHHDSFVAVGEMASARAQELGIALSIRQEDLMPPTQHPDVPDDAQFILPPRGDYDTSTALEDILTFEGIDEDALTLAEAAVEAAIQRLSFTPSTEDLEDLEQRLATAREETIKATSFARETELGRQKLLDIKTSSRPRWHCSWLYRFLYFYGDGTSLPCCFTEIGSYGDSREMGVKELFNGPKNASLLNSFTTNEPYEICATCNFRREIPEHYLAIE